MDKAKAAVTGFLSKDGKHSTTVHETVNPAVQNEHVTKTHHENVQTAVDREIHQDHHHTSVQPIQHKEVLPEQHSHNLAGVENREVHHGNNDHVKQRLEAERAQFKNTQEIGQTQHTQAAAPTLTGEHIHHHVHETIQPVIQKETVQPSVVHTTIPVHEVHHNEAKHHTASALPAVSLADFKSQGGVLGGREERTDAFEGEPRQVGSTLSNQNGGSHHIGGRGADGTTSLTEKDGQHSHSHVKDGGLTGQQGTTGSTGTSTGQQGMTGSTGTSTGQQGMTGSTGTSTGRQGTTGAVGSSTGMSGTSSTTGTGKKPSLMDKINPKVDSNGDGQAGFMK